MNTVVDGLEITLGVKRIATGESRERIIRATDLPEFPLLYLMAVLLLALGDGCGRMAEIIDDLTPPPSPDATPSGTPPSGVH